MHYHIYIGIHDFLVHYIIKSIIMRDDFYILIKPIILHSLHL